MGMHTLWWKPKRVVLKGTSFCSTDGFEPYNPFVYYHSHTRKETTRSVKSLHYEFLGVNTEDRTAVESFCRRYGVLGRLDNPGWIAWGMEKSGSDELLKALGFDEPSPLGLLYEQDQRGSRRRQIVGIAPDSSLCVPMEWEDFKRAQGQLREATQWASVVVSRNRSRDKAMAHAALSERFRWKLTMTRPNLSWDAAEGKWSLAWDIGSLEAAFYLMLLSDVCAGGHIQSCKLCGTLFLGITSRGRFCSKRCLNTFKVRRFRARKKNLSRKRITKDVRNGPAAG